MLIAKMALWYDPQWWGARRVKGNWRKRRYWLQTLVKDARPRRWNPLAAYVPRSVASYTLGPLRLDVRITHGQ